MKAHPVVILLAGLVLGVLAFGLFVVAIALQMAIGSGAVLAGIALSAALVCSGWAGLAVARRRRPA